MILTFWINAFIPKIVGQYTQYIQTGPHAGKTAVPLPQIARAAPGNLIKPKHTGYLTDQRSFSKNRKASVRMQSCARFDLETLAIIPGNQRTQHWTSGTTEVNIETGQQLGFAYADMSRCKFTSSKQNNIKGGSPAGTMGGHAQCIEYALKAAAGDPLVQAAADIDYVGTIKVCVNKKAQEATLSFNGKIDAFPAFEAYVSNGKEVQTLFRCPPPAGNTVENLVGWANRPVEGRAVFHLPGV